MHTFKAQIGSTALVTIFMFVGSASAQLSTDDQKCIDAYNNGLRLVSQQAGKSARNCIKNAGKGKESNPDQCVDENTDGKIAGKEAKVAALFAAGGKCDPVPSVIVQTAAIGNAAHRGAVQDLVHGMFGDPVSGVISPGTREAKCQDKAIQRATQYFTTSIKVFRKCKKDGLKSGAITTEADLHTACLNGSGATPFADPDLKIAAARAKFEALFATGGVCDDLFFYLPGGGVFPDAPGCGALDPTTCVAFLQYWAAAKACEAARDADGLLLPLDCAAF